MPVIMVNEKTCVACGCTKLATDFYRSSNYKDGLQYECIPCAKLRTKEYALANREKVLCRKKRYRESNQLKISAGYNQWLMVNRDKRRAIDNKWGHCNIGKVTAKSRARKLAKLNRTPAWANKQEIEQIYIECTRVSRETGIKHHVDHIIPLRGKTVSGLHVENNLQIITVEENLRKNNKFDIDKED